MKIHCGLCDKDMESENPKEYKCNGIPTLVCERCQRELELEFSFNEAIKRDEEAARKAGITFDEYVKSFNEPKEEQ